VNPIHLHEVGAHRPKEGPLAPVLAAVDQGFPVPQILHLFAWRPEATQHLARFTQAVMREARELSPGQCELIAAFVSGKNDCLF
jgi:hypothetical protein